MQMRTRGILVVIAAWLIAALPRAVWGISARSGTLHRLVDFQSGYWGAGLQLVGCVRGVARVALRTRGSVLLLHLDGPASGFVTLQISSSIFLKVHWRLIC